MCTGIARIFAVGGALSRGIILKFDVLNGVRFGEIRLEMAFSSAV